MTSVLVSPDGKYEYEAAHGTVTRHYYKHLAGEETSTNPMATIFAWSGAFRKRGELDKLPELVKYADELEAACFDTLNEGIVTKDLVNLMEGITPTAVNSENFIKAIRQRSKSVCLSPKLYRSDATRLRPIFRISLHAVAPFVAKQIGRLPFWYPARLSADRPHHLCATRHRLRMVTNT